ncbi:MAG: DUF402 domain-containing protein [bacterium]|nr:DUF402 domain-containing protein [bacterium]
MTRAHWRFDMHFLDEDKWGVWLWTPPGSTAQRGDEPAQTFDHLNVKLIAPSEWWTAIWNDSGRYDLYVDIVTPAAWRDNRVTMIDLDLDVVRTADGTVIVDDEDEFLDHQVKYGYPDAVIEKTRSTADTLQQRIQDGEEPFAEVGASRMLQAAQLAQSQHR